jgi:hypothetical protein
MFCRQFQQSSIGFLRFNSAKSVFLSALYIPQPVQNKALFFQSRQNSIEQLSKTDGLCRYQINESASVSKAVISSATAIAVQQINKCLHKDAPMTSSFIL